MATTLPHSDPKASEFTRANGKMRTTLHARLTLIHLATGAVRTRSRRFVVGRSINDLLDRLLRLCPHRELLARQFHDRLG